MSRKHFKRNRRKPIRVEYKLLELLSNPKELGEAQRPKIPGLYDDISRGKLIAYWDNRLNV